MSLQIAGLHYYPIKSCAGTTVAEARLLPQGIEHDRRWMLIDSDGKFLSQREHPALALIRPTVCDHYLTVTMGDNDPGLRIPLDRPEPHSLTATVWKFTGAADDEGDEAAAWFTARLGFPCRLVRAGARWDRPLSPDHSQPNDRTGFADGYPVLLTTESSLAYLNTHLDSPVPMTRFRPNIVLSGDLAPWIEDTWAALSIPATGARLRAAKPCARCLMITIDQDTAAKTGPEPLTTLSLLRRSAGKVLFGVNLIPEAPALLRIGDTVDVYLTPLQD